MSVASFEAVIENGNVKLPDEVRLPERTKVYVVVPGVRQLDGPRVLSPRLARPTEAQDFSKSVIPDAKL